MANNFNCPQCGAARNKNDNFCKYCGEVFQQAQQVQQPMQRPMQHQYPNNNMHYPPPPYRYPVKRQSSGCFTAFIIVTIIMVIVFGAMCMGVPLTGTSLFNASKKIEESNLKKNEEKTNVKTDGINLVKNSGAEEDFKSWEQHVEKDEYKKFDLNINSTNAFNGKKCFYMEASGGSGYIKQTLKMEKGKKYLLSLFEKSASSKANDVSATFLFKSADGEDEIKFDVPNTKNWKVQKKVIQVPNNIKTEQIPFKVSISGYTEGVYIDDIKVEKVVENTEVKATGTKK